MSTDEKFRCICDPDDIFDPPDPRPVAVEGCPAHRFRRAAQQFALQVAEHQARLAAEPKWICEACGYHNVGGICTHCGRLAAEPKETP